MKTDNTDKYAKNIVDDTVDQLNVLPGICERNRVEAKRGLEIDNWLYMAIQGVELMAVKLRHYHDIKGAQEALGKAWWAAKKATEAFDYYESFGELGASPIHRTAFPKGIAIAWLNRDWELAEKFAGMTSSEELFFSSGEGDYGSLHEIIAYMFSAMVVGNSDDFSLWYARYKQEAQREYDIGNEYWNQYFVYPAMMQALIDQNQSGFTKLLLQADQSFAARGKDKTIKGLPTVDGPPGFNLLTIDYNATSLSLFALHRGMNIDFESPALPINTIHSWDLHKHGAKY